MHWPPTLVMPVVGFAALLALPAHVGVGPELSQSQAASPDTGAKHPRNQDPSPFAPSPRGETNLIYLGQPVASSDVTFTIERTPCFGECPYYFLQVHGDGRVDWEGKYFVARQIWLHRRIEPEAVQMLLDRAGEMDFFQHAVSFDETGNDGTNCKLTLHIAGQERSADVPHDFGRTNWDGTPSAGWETMRDEVDFTRAVDALTETWRWIHTVEEAAPEPDALPAKVPDGFSIGIRRHIEPTYPAYTLMIDAGGSGSWHGTAHVLEIGDRTFTIPHEQMLLLSSRARNLVGLGQNIVVEHDQDSATELYVHADGHEPPLRTHVSPLEKRGSSLLAVEYVKAAALADLVDVFARTSHFTGAWEDRQADATSTTSTPK